MSGIQFNRVGGGFAAGMSFGGLLFFTLFWCGITGVFVGFMSFTAYRIADAKMRFLPTEGVVVASRIETSRGSKGGTNYKPVVEYKYTVDGRGYQSDRYEFMAMSSSSGKRSVAAVVAKYPADTKITVYYDPKHPDSAVISREVPEMLVFMALFLQPFVLVGIGMMIATVLAGRDWVRGRAFRKGNVRTPPWPVPGWGVLRQEPGGALVLRGGGRVQAAAMSFAMGYGLTCFISIFVVAFGFLVALQGKYGVFTPAFAAFVLALVVGVLTALRTWGKGEPKVTFTFQPSRGKVTLEGGEHKEPACLRLDEISGLLLRNEWRTQKTKNGSTSYEVFLPKLVTADGQEFGLAEFRIREDADHLLAEFANLLGKPVEVEVAEAAEDEDAVTPPKSICELVSLVRNQWKKKREK